MKSSKRHCDNPKDGGFSESLDLKKFAVGAYGRTEDAEIEQDYNG
jgi:hypothetical protein